MRKFIALVSIIIVVLFYVSDGKAEENNWLIQTEFQEGEGRLMRFPDIAKDKIIFVYAGDIYIVSEKGGIATKLTSGVGLELFPKFSPDGSKIAFTGQYDGNFNVYVMNVAGGEPKQLTFNPDVEPVSERMGPNNQVIEWFPDGKYILFRSRQNTYNTWFGHLFKVSIEGGIQQQLILPEGGLASFSPEGDKIAYNRIFRNFRTWKRYFGGLAQDIWIYDFKKNKSERITDWKGTDSFPMWYQNKIYFTSDRDKNLRLNIWSYDLRTKEFKQITFFKEYDVMWPSIGGDKIVFENGGYIYETDLNTEITRRVPIIIQSDNAQALTKWVKAEKFIKKMNISPDGKRVVLEARGDIFTVPVEKGSIRNLTRTSGFHEKNPAWSPDGQWIAYISDESGEEEIYIVNQKGDREPIRITTDGSVFRYELIWSPDSQKLLYSDKSLRLWYVDINKRKPVLIDKDKFWEIREYVWSPDSKWVAYAKYHENYSTSIYFYSLEAGKSELITSEFTNDYSPVFDPGGRYLYFISERHFNPALDVRDENFIYQKNAGIYLITLQKDISSPFAPSSDESEPFKEEEKKDGKEEAKKGFRIDLEGIRERIVAFPIKGGNYGQLQANKGNIFYLSYPVRGLGGAYPGEKNILYRYNLEKRKEFALIEDVDNFVLSYDGKKILYRAEQKGIERGQSQYIYGVISSDSEKTLSIGEGKLNLSGMKVKVNLKEEWVQMFKEVWRIERDFFYNPEMNGINWKEQYEKYFPLVSYVGTRYDLNYIFGEMLGELGNSHTYVQGGDYPEVEGVNVGMLGVDWELDEKTGYYRIKKIYKGDNSRDGYRSPLTEPNIRIKEGDYILAVNNKELKYPVNPYSLFENTVGENVELKVNSEANFNGARVIMVKPIGSEFNLRYLEWVDNNREKVEKASGGKIGYIYLPDMSEDGLNEFQRQFFPQIRKEGLIIDVRYNGGGFVDQMILERLRRILIGMGMSRNGGDTTIPYQVFHGYLVCLANQYSASDGDIFPYYFREYKLGPIIGMRTWGGVRGIRGYISLIDNGNITVPEFSIYGLESQWIIENYGVPPDIEVDNLPELVIQGKDPQLEKAIEYLMEKIKTAPKKLPPRPKYLPAFPPQGDWHIKQQ